MQKRFEIHYRNFFFKKEDSFSLFSLQKKALQEKISDKTILGLFESYIFGKQKNLDKETKSIHSTLGLIHLFTPSGIHLTAMLIFFFPLAKFIRKKSEKIYLLSSFLLCLFPYFFLSGYYSIRRILLLRFFKIFIIKVSRILGGKQCPWFPLFLLTFFVDFFLGTYSSSPLSFIYSFLFLGIIFSVPQTPKILLPLGLLSGQILISFFTTTPVNILGVCLGFILTGLFSLIFPILFFSFIFSPILPLIIAKLCLEVFLKLLEYAHLFSRLSPTIFISLSLLSVFFITALRLKSVYKKILIVFFLCLHSTPILNANFKENLTESLYSQIRPLYNKALLREGLDIK